MKLVKGSNNLALSHGSAILGNSLSDIEKCEGKE